MCGPKRKPGPVEGVGGGSTNAPAPKEPSGGSPIGSGGIKLPGVNIPLPGPGGTVPTSGPMNPIDVGAGGPSNPSGKPYNSPLGGDPLPSAGTPGSGGTPSLAPMAPDAQAPTPSPDPTMVDPNPEETAAQKLKRLRAMRSGLMSTILTSSQGTQAPPLVSSPGLYGSGTKGKLGQ